MEAENFDWTGLSLEGVEAAADANAPIPEGSYFAKINRCYLNRTATKQTPYIHLELIILEGEYRGRRLFKDWWLTEKFLPYLKRDLLMFGFEGDISEFQHDDTLRWFLDRQVRVGVRHEVYEERTTAKVYLNGVIPLTETVEIKEPFDSAQGPPEDDLDYGSTSVATPASEKEADPLPF